MAGGRLAIIHTHSPHLASCAGITDRNPAIAEFCRYLAAALVTIRQLIRRAPQPLPLGHPPHHQRLK